MAVTKVDRVENDRKLNRMRIENIYKTLPSPSRFYVEGDNAYVEIAERKIPIGGVMPKLKKGESHLHYTTSLCPVCMRLLPARIFERDGKVYIRKICPEHGEFEELYYGDSKLYTHMMSFEETGKGPGKIKAYVGLSAPCPFNCGFCPMHENHTALANLVVTNRCNLSCYYCFFYAERAGYIYEPSIELLRYQVRQLKKQGVTMAIQITGGEPTLRNDLPDIIKMLREEGVKHIQLNTAGVKFAELYFKDPEEAISYSKTLREAGVNTVYMSFDGVSPKANIKNHWEIPYIFEVFRKSGMTSVVLVPVLIKNMNLHEVGKILKFAAKNLDIVRGVNFQPVSLTGQLKKSEREQMRVTIADAIKAIEEQTDGQIPRETWAPIPYAAKFAKFIEAVTGTEQFCMSNHPMCGAANYVYVEKAPDGTPIRFIPIGSFFDIKGFAEYLDRERINIMDSRAKKLHLLKGIIDLRKFIYKEKMPKGLKFSKLLTSIILKRSYDALGQLHYNMLFIGMMHFMDMYNYDVERVRRCNISYLMPDGRVVPFCAFNVMESIYRDYVQKKYKKADINVSGLKGFNPGEKYDRSKYLPKILKDPLYREAYKGFI
ncbi:MAG: radical SAM protein [Caldisphaeraceae archaeon]|nr:radical SAM protein [Caldisphaeraceae archaeon]MEB3692113.1 radical SAM protein [Caldisphaeraceae archaeon]MEB3797896.1 radical SAM protein [Caldisphaeraceae archaeon]